MKSQNLLELIKQTESEVKRLGYSVSSQKKYSKIWNKLKEYCEDKYDEYTVDIGNQFLEDVFNISESYYLEKGHHDSYRSIMILNSYMCYGKIYTKYFIKKHNLNEFYQSIFDEYLNYCKTNNNSVKTIRYKNYAIKRFLLILSENGITDLNNITFDTVKKYLESLVNLSQNSIKIYMYSLRDFLRFLYSTKKTTNKLEYLVPSLKISKYPNIPSVWKKEDIKKMIDAIDTQNPIGKRDYAMLLLVAKLGIRVMDLKHLTVNNIDWKKKEINFIMSKTKQQISLPLPNDIGWAIIDYLKNGRPACDSKVIFIRHVKPIGPFSDFDALSGIIRKYMNLAKIKIDDDDYHKKGMHSLRHSLATNLLKNNIQIDSISSILGHNNRSSVSYYLKVDTDKLIECCGDDEYYEI